MRLENRTSQRARRLPGWRPSPFAPLVLNVPEAVMVNNFNLALELENLSCCVQH